MVKSPSLRTRLDPVVLTDPRAIKALAHPARLAVIEEFFSGRKLTATECADISGLSASAMSYHLRALEKWGIIKRSESTEDGRERPWEAAGRGLRIESTDPVGSSTGESVLITRMLDRQRVETLQWVNRPDRRTPPDKEWDEVMSIVHTSAWLTPEQARELSGVVEDLLRGFDKPPAGVAPPGTRKTRLSFSLVPIVDEQSDPVAD